jgi:hypothetical protein
MLEYVPVSFVFQRMVSVGVLESVLDRSPCDSLDNVRMPLHYIHGNGVPHLLFDEDYYTQQHRSLFFSLSFSLFILVFIAVCRPLECSCLGGRLETWI